MIDIVISACTFRRPAGLTALFDSLIALRVPPDVALSLRIVDNDEAPTSRDLVARLAERAPWPVHYVHEPQPGIPVARNRALSEAQDADFLVFVDDDETVAEDWLEALCRQQKASAAHFVQGPVIPTVEHDADAWWVKSLFFKQRTFPDGAARHESWTNNVMIDLDFVRRHDGAFDPALRYDGGSDTLFFQDLARKGAKGVYAAHAYVYEVQPPSRLTWSWALKRQFRYGMTRVNCTVLRDDSWTARLHCLARGGACAVVGLLLLPTTLVRGRVGLANACAYLARAAGIASGLAGGRHLEYARQPLKSA
jgi:succinoglycan biosynthesis protein ExoM